MVDPHQDFYMRIAMRISAYADHPHEPHGSATAWPSLVSVVVDIGKDDSFTLKEDVRVMWGKELWAPFQPVFA